MFHHLQNIYRAIILSVFFVCYSYHTQAQDKKIKDEKVQQQLYTGFLFQKTYGGYYENGLSILYSPIWQNDRLFLGFDYITSRLGSAIGSNALKVDNYVFSTLYLFLKNYRFRPFTKINIGINYSDYEFEIFKDLSSSSMLLSLEAGGVYQTKKIPFMASLSIGYNLTSTDGSGSGSMIFPLFFRLGVYYDILKLFN